MVLKNIFILIFICILGVFFFFIGGMLCCDIWDYWKRGGRFIQIYSSFIFEGPSLFNQIKQEIDSCLKKNDCSTLEELLGKIDQAQR